MRKLAATMSIGQKLLLGFLGVSLLVAAVGIFGLSAVSRTARHFEGGELHFRSIVIAATDLSTAVTSAESALMMFLALRNPADRESLLRKSETLESLLAALDRNMRLPEARTILDETRSKTREFISVGASLLRVCHEDTRSPGGFGRHSGRA